MSSSESDRKNSRTVTSTTDPLATTLRPLAPVTPVSADPIESTRQGSSSDATLDSNTGVPAPEVRVGMVLGGRYELLAELGRGAGGIVFRAQDTKAEAIV